MNGIIVEIEGYQKSAEVPGDVAEEEVESALLERMKRAYDEFFETRYEAGLPKNQKNETIYPQFTMILDEEIYELVFDYDLFEQLCDLYIIEGWSGVVEIEKRIEEITKDESRELPGGVQDKKWAIDVHPKEVNAWHRARNFFAFTQRMLALLIRESLANVERFSAEQIIAKLSVTNIEIARAFDRYQIQDRKEVSEQRPSLDSPAVKVETSVYSIGKAALGKDLFDVLTKAVNEKYDFDLYVKKVNYLPSAINEAIARSKEPNSFSSDPAFRNTQRIRAEEMKKELPKYASLKDASEKLLKTFESVLKSKHPLGLLIYNSLKKDFKQPEMENLFGQTLDGLRKDLEKLAVGIDPQVLAVEELLPFQRSEDLSFDILRFQIPAGGLEKFVLETSLANFKKSRFLPLISQDSLNRLIDDEIIKIDSFENTVCFHYLSALVGRLDEIADEEKKAEDFWQTISRISAALSFAVLIVPFAPGLAPLIRGGAALADLALLAYTISRVTGTLKKFDRLMQKTLVNQDDFTTESFAELGEVLALRKEFYENFSEQLAIEIFNIFVGGKLPVFKQLLLARAYYSDLETLTETDEEGEAQE